MNTLRAVSRHAPSLLTGASLMIVALLLPTNAVANPAFTVLHQFHNGGQVSLAGLANVGGHLFGTTTTGGAGGTGRVFRVNLAGGNGEFAVHDFAADGSDGKSPHAGLIKVGQFLYGTAHNGGNSTDGTLFKVQPNGLGFMVLHNFTCCGDGQFPAANLISVGGFIYGATQVGGTNGWGSVFRLNTSTNAYSTFYSFAGGADGQNPYGGLTRVGNYLYGTTRDGGTSGQGQGTVFRIKISTGIKQTLHVFTGGATDGANPYSAMVSFGGALIGTTIAGGGSPNCYGGCGTVFKIDPSGSPYSVLHFFIDNPSGSDGEVPQGGLLPVYVNAGTTGLLYGTTTSGGTSGIGTIYSIDINGNEVVVHSFAGNQGASPASELINVVDGNGHNQLYGTAYNGGLYGYGSVFRFTP